MNFRDSVKKTAFAVFSQIKRAYRFTDRHPWIQCIILGIVLNLTVESLSRHSFVSGLAHMVGSPLVFFFNSLIITFVMSLCTLSKRRNFFYLFFGALWLGFGIANCVLLTMRITPLEWADLQVVKISLIKIYLNTAEIILIAAVILAAVAALVLFFIKGPKLKKVSHLKNSIAAVSFGVVLTASLIGFRSNGVLLSKHVKNLANAYKDYGFTYCFMCSMLDLGIDKPSQYDKNDVTGMVNAVNNAAENNSAVKNADFSDENGNQPNIIFLQLETFFDVNHLSNVKFSENPIPNFTNLQQNYSSGYLTVPSIGAGTANTEFEVISGMSLEYFGVGEYPYKTILKSEPSESVCYNLKKYGYTSHAIHNNTASFYDRNTVFSNLGFDTFTSKEYMDGLEFTPAGWAKDNVLVGCITDALDSTEGSDFVYTITVQSHGKYPSDYEGELPISVTGTWDEETNRSFEYYINQLKEVDAFIGDLLDVLAQRGERTVVVMYGDHLPSFDISAENLLNGDLFQTEYVIWDNFGLVKENGSFYSYQLAADIMGRLGFDNGLLTRLHQNFAEDKRYQTYLEVFEYDMLYGEKYAWGGKTAYPYITTNLKMGVKEITISDVVYADDDGTVKITGDNFTAYSKVFINDSEFDTELVDSHTLIVTGARLAAGDRIAVVQVGDERTPLSSSKYYLIGGTEENPTVSVDSREIIYKTRGLDLPTVIAIITASLAVISVSVYLILRTVKKKKDKVL